MADAQAAAASQVESTGASQVDTASESASPADAPDIQTRLETLEKELRRVRRENQNLRKRPDAPPADDKADAPALSEVDKLKRERERAETERERVAAELRQERLSRLAEREAQAAHAVYPDLVALLLEKDLEFEEGEDKPSNLNTLLGTFRRKYPLLFRAPSGDGGAGGVAPSAGQDMNALIRQAAGRR